MRAEYWTKQLEEDYDWRITELSELKVLIAKSSSKNYREILIKSLWVMLYAYYEGYCIFATNLLLDYIVKTSKPRCEYIDPIYDLSLENHKQKDKTISNFFQEIQDKSQENITFPNKLSSKSNLSPDLLIDVCNKIGIDASFVEKNRDKLEFLLKRRNDLAHGNLVSIEALKNYTQFYEAAEDVMIELCCRLTESIENKQYLKNQI